MKQGNLGFQVVDLQSGQILVESAAGHFFAPASNTKLYTTAAALVRLGPQYSWETQLTTQGPWKPGQASLGNLQFVGGGDPNLSGRKLPYEAQKDDEVAPTITDPFAPISALADQIVARGIKLITGDVTGVSGRYADERYPDGWTIDDSNYSYGAPVTSLAINDNSVTLVLHPTKPGDLAALSLEPPTSHFVIVNEALTVAEKESRVSLTRWPGSNELVVTGLVGTGPTDWREDVAIDDPALFAAEALIDVLRDKGINVLGEPHSFYGKQNSSAATVLATRQSPPLWQAVQVVNKVSQNLHAEMLLRELGLIGQGTVQSGLSTLQSGLDQRQTFLFQAGIQPPDLDLEDGSGLARQDLTSPVATIKLLQYMWNRPERNDWLPSLPVGGVDGSLQHRFKGIENASVVHAKTGSYSHVNTLSGYIEQRPAHWLAFSVMVNGTVSPASEIRDFLDRFCRLFVK